MLQMTFITFYPVKVLLKLNIELRIIRFSIETYCFIYVYLRSKQCLFLFLTFKKSMMTANDMWGCLKVNTFLK